jgi:hypothetical protein
MTHESMLQHVAGCGGRAAELGSWRMVHAACLSAARGESGTGGPPVNESFDGLHASLNSSCSGQPSAPAAQPHHPLLQWTPAGSASRRRGAPAAARCCRPAAAPGSCTASAWRAGSCSRLAAGEIARGWCCCGDRSRTHARTCCWSGVAAGMPIQARPAGCRPRGRACNNSGRRPTAASAASSTPTTGATRSPRLASPSPRPPLRASRAARRPFPL